VNEQHHVIALSIEFRFYVSLHTK